MCSGAVPLAKRRLAQAAECMQEVRQQQQQPTNEADSHHGVPEQVGPPGTIGRAIRSSSTSSGHPLCLLHPAAAALQLAPCCCIRLHAVDVGENLPFYTPTRLALSHPGLPAAVPGAAEPTAGGAPSGRHGSRHLHHLCAACPAHAPRAHAHKVGGHLAVCLQRCPHP